ncbi:conserved protein of unknown function [Candidatus Filomicrobium marinum]|uniref:Uncharacterized protein n=3 Tax=Hyphomicrobiaceae TaxID=45401 RepID=A0A0D6JHE7_9HYPH|nr:conserved protein of unknown function [Candidatus Filomicrobium marinum]CPR20336.1 conserved protein of unknown function [Candidatus Filomicrobium marinum]SDP13579.1 hypothetical protein SAMN04488061_2288 [Filomicrobium insigne]
MVSTALGNPFTLGFPRGQVDLMSRLKRNEQIPPCVYLVADHLDAALAAGEDLIAAAQSWQPGECCDPAIVGVQRWTLSRVMTYEMALVTRVVKAREHVADLADAAPHFRPLAQLFVSGTRDLYEALKVIGDTAALDFDTGDGTIAYLRSRGLIAADAPGLADYAPLTVNDDFLVASRIPLGVVLDLISEFIEALDAQFELYPDEPEFASDSSPDGSFSVLPGDEPSVRADSAA